ncbi:MAG: pilus assembly protein N-terminal domain-containing protein [Planctomycetia bacterium]|nr:pilus assembly protein N-terminal domain-containing protein [Planctomycetia bacterium]
MTTSALGRECSRFYRHALVAVCSASAIVGLSEFARAQQPSGQPIVHKVQGTNDRLEMVVNTSRILTLDQKVPQVQAANPDVVELTPLSATQVQVLAKKAGVTQVNLWDDKDNIHTIDVIVYGDTRELAMLLQSQFPTTSLRVVPTANSVIISGHVDDPNQISRITQIAEDFYPKVINNITVAGVQQVLLKVKVMEIARERLRNLGVDLRWLNDHNFLQTGLTGTLGVTSGTGAPVAKGFVSPLTPATEGLQLSGAVLDPNSSFFGFMEALRKDQLATILAEPNLVSYSGRPAFFNSGGEFPILVPQSLGTVSIQYKKFGTEVEFVPIVLGGNAIRLEIKPRVSEIDPTRSVTVNGINVPALRVREANTGVEMRAGQTLALAGLVQQRNDNVKRELPFFGELPFVGAVFRRVSAHSEEVELLIMVTPFLVDALDPCDVPRGGPGLFTGTPSDCQLYLKGHIEVPRCPADDACAPSRSPGSEYEYNGNYGYNGPPLGTAPPPMPLGPPMDAEMGPEMGPRREVIQGAEEVPPAARRSKPVQPSPNRNTTAATNAVPASQRRSAAPARPASGTVGNVTAGPNRAISYNPTNRVTMPAQPAQPASRPSAASPGFIGPVGYDVKQ